MDLTHVIFVALALVATSSGFVAHRQARQGFFARQHQRLNPGMPPRRPVSRLSHRVSSQSAVSQHPALKHSFSMRGLNRNNVPINIVSNIFVNHPRSQKNSTTHHTRPTGSPSKGHGQGQGRGHGKRGRRPTGHNRRMLNGKGQGRNRPHTRGTGSGPTDNQIMAIYNVQGHYPAGLTRIGRRMTGGQQSGGPSNSGHGQLVQLTLPVVNGSSLSSLLIRQGQRQTAGSGSASSSGGANSQVIILPSGLNTGPLVLSGGHGLPSGGLNNGPLVLSGGHGLPSGGLNNGPLVLSGGHGLPSGGLNNGPLVLSGGQGIQFQGLGAKAAAGGNTFIVDGKKPPKSSGILTATTLKPGEDPPEVEATF